MNSSGGKSAVIGIVFLAVIGLIIVGAWLWISPRGSGFFATVVERISGETPESKVDAYLRAVAGRDKEAALDLWELPNWELPDGRSEGLRERREDITRTLLESGLDLEDYMILRIEWWRTCCEPGVICDSRDAGGARMRVQFLEESGRPVAYIFDLFTRGGPYWGGAESYPPRQWVLRDVYRRDQEPLFWRMVWEPKVRYLD